MLEDKIEYELKEINKEVSYVLENKNISDDKMISNCLFNLEKHRFNILNYIRSFKTSSKVDIDIQTINDEYRVEYRNYFKIYIPEVLPKYKYIGNYTYKNILLNVANVTKQYRNLFKGKQVCIYIRVFDNTKKENWDIDNKTIKPIIDGLVLSNVIEDDSIQKMFYIVKGDYHKVPHTEVTILDGKQVIKFLNKRTEIQD